MKHFSILVIVLLAPLLVLGKNHHGHQPFYGNFRLIRLDTRGVRPQGDLFKFLSDRVDFWTDPSFNSTVDFMVSPREYRNVVHYLRKHHLPYDVLMKDVQRQVDAQLRRVDTHKPPGHASDRVSSNPRRPPMSWLGFLTQPFRNSQSHDERFGDEHRKRKGHSMNWDEYQRLGVIYEYMYYLEDRYPHFAQVIDIGPTVQKRRMRLLKIGSGAYSDKPAIFIEAGIHAREWIAPATATFIMRELVENHEQNLDILDFYDIYVLPVANPDGYEFSFWGNRLWRKNRASNGGLGFIIHNCDGVDLNRNFGYHWLDASPVNPQAGTQISCSETYSGPYPFSEPESRNIAKFVSSIEQNVVSYLMIHNYGQKILYPWSYSAERVPDWRDLQAMGEVMAREIEAASGRNYVVGSSPQVQYFASGGSDDWARGSMGIKWVFLLELPDKGVTSFFLPSSEIKPTGFSIFQGIRALAVQVSHTLV